MAQQAGGGAAAGAAGGAHHGVGLGFGEVVMLGDFNTNFSNGIGFNINYTFESTSRFGLFVQLHWNNHGNTLSPTDSLSIKGLLPNLKFNLFKIDSLTVSVFGGLGAYKVSETLGALEGSWTLFALDAGAIAFVEVDPHFRFGPSLSMSKVSSGTDNSNVATGQPALIMGGTLVELMFNLMYVF